MEYQINYLLLLQNFRESFGNFLTPIFSYITAFGQYLIVALTISFIYWVIDKKNGTFLILNGGFALALCHMLKNIVCIPRPWIIDSRINPVQTAMKFAWGYSFPSGHTTIAVSCWGAIAKIWKSNKLLQICMIILCLLVALSRNYLGVHTPQDVILAIIIGVIILKYGYQIYLWLNQKENGYIILSGFITIFALVVFIHSFIKTTYYPECIPCLAGGYARAGYLIGISIGLFLEKKFVKFDFTNLEIIEKIIICVVGGLLLTYIMCYTQESLKSLVGNNAGYGLHSFLDGFFMIFLYPYCVKLFLGYKGSVNKFKKDL